MRSLARVCSARRSASKTNSDAEPEAIVPAPLQLTVNGGVFQHAFSPASVTVIELSR
jgi:hypothetical protein